MTIKIFFNAIIKFSIGFISIFLLIFIPAGTLYFINGWLFIATLFIPMFVLGIVMMLKRPDLLKKRLNIKENQHGQGFLVQLSAIMFIVAFILAGLNYRFKWHSIPFSISIAATILFLIIYLMYAVLIFQNSYLSRIVEIQTNQTVIDFGFYKIVRHPMYSLTLLLFFSIPVILSSLISFVALVFYPFIIIKRIKLEEIMLEKKLIGYSEYKNKVKFRLIPFIW